MYQLMWIPIYVLIEESYVSEKVIYDKLCIDTVFSL